MELWVWGDLVLGLLYEAINQLHILPIAQVKISDFGISKLTTSSQDLEVGELLVGFSNIDVLLKWPRSCCGYKGAGRTRPKTWDTPMYFSHWEHLWCWREREREEEIEPFLWIHLEHYTTNEQLHWHDFRNPMCDLLLPLKDCRTYLGSRDYRAPEVVRCGINRKQKSDRGGYGNLGTWSTFFGVISSHCGFGVVDCFLISRKLAL